MLIKEFWFKYSLKVKFNDKLTVWIDKNEISKISGRFM